MNSKRAGMISGLAIGLMAFSASLPTIALAQTTPVGVSAIDAKNLGLGQIAQKISKSSGIAVVTDSNLTTTPVTFSTIGGSLDTVLTQLAAILPAGATIRAALVPDTGTTPDGDDVMAMLRAHDAFATKVVSALGAPVTAVTPTFTPGKFDLLGRSVTLEEASAQIATLHLRPVYVVTRQRPAVDPVGKLNSMKAEELKQWGAMTSDQRKQAMEIQFKSMMNMEPGDRQALMGQMVQQGMYLMQTMQQMPPEQMKEFQKEIMTEVGKSGMLPPGAGGGGRMRTP